MRHWMQVLCTCSIALLGALACSDDAQNTGTEMACIPGATQACVCTNGAMGSQACNDAGARFESCICDDPSPDPQPGMDPDPQPGVDPEPGMDPDPQPGVDPNPDPVVDCAEADLFIDVSERDGPGEGLPDPTLSASCTDDTLIVRSNGIPHYEFVRITPNELQAQNYTWEIPRDPVRSDTKVDIPLLGVAGIMVNGLPFYGPNEGPMPDPFGDPVFNGILDFCLGHTAQRGDYHYHALLDECFFPEDPEGSPSRVLGFANDGFPIYGPMECVDEDCTSLIELKSSWVQTGDPTTQAWDNHDCTREECEEGSGEFLDRCNGHVGPNGDYHYHATETFPYILGCYHGEQDDGPDPEPGMEPDMNPDMGPDMMGPQSCTQESDCDGACMGNGTGCTCVNSPMGMICVPTCNTDNDCPEGPMGELVCNGMGFCAPQM